MKVTTDGCLFGAWVANEVKKQPSEAKKILDIGAGTGLLSLMLAQVTSVSHIEAIEINKAAFLEASSNFSGATWSDRLKCIHTSLQKFKPKEKYGLIICNPPFFSKNQKGRQADKNQAVHNDHLSMGDLSESISKLLKGDGSAFVLYPEKEMHEFVSHMKNQNLFLSKEVEVKNEKDGSVFRIMGEFSNFTKQSESQTIVIKGIEGVYTASFSELLEDYYLS